MKVSDIILIIAVIGILVGFGLGNDNLIGPSIIVLIFTLFTKLITKGMERE